MNNQENKKVKKYRSIRIEEDLFWDIKKCAVENKMQLQDAVALALINYINDEK